MNPIKLNSIAVMNLFTSQGMDAESTKHAAQLYELAKKYERAIEAITRLGDNLEDSLRMVRQGRVPTFDLARTAIELEQKIIERNEAQNTFGMVAEAYGYTVTE